MADLYNHQREAIKAALPVIRSTGGFYLNHDPGMGKSLTAIGIARLLKCRHVLILGPVVSVGVWIGSEEELGEIRRWWPGAVADTVRGESWSSLSSSIKRNTQAAELSNGEGSPYFIVTNYDQTIVRVSRKEKEQLLQDNNGDQKKALRKANELKKKRLDAKLKPFLDWGIDLLILDESQMVKDMTADRSRVARTLASHSRYRLLLSGTPEHSPLDWWSQWNIVAPTDPMWGQPFSAYKRWIAVLGGTGGLWVKGFRPDAKAAADKARGPYMHEAKVSLLNLPEPIITPTPISMTEEETKYYNQMERLLTVEIDGQKAMTAAIVLTKTLRLSQITAGHLQEKGVKSSKMAACLEMLDLRRHQKVIVACRFSWEINELKKALDKAKIPAVVIDGSTPGPARTGIQEEFQNPNDHGGKVIVAQFRAGGMSLTLTKTDALIFYSLEHSFIAYRQMFGRFFRIGLDHATQVIPLLCQGTTDWVIWKGLQDKSTDNDMASKLRAFLKRSKP